MRANESNNSPTEKKVGMMPRKTVVITGATSGLGLETAKYFVSIGYTVIMAVRNVTKGEEVKSRLMQEYPEGTLDVHYVDLGKLTTVREFAASFSRKYSSLDLLINNAGVLRPSFSKTEEGVELQFGCNHLGHFALTGLLLPLLEQGTRPRVVTLSSIAYRTGVIDFDNLDGSKGYNGIKFYSQSKLANLLFAKELDERLKRHGLRTRSIAAHPGISSTNIFKIGKKTPFFIKLAMHVIGQSPEKGVLPTIMAAMDQNLEGGEYIGPNGFGNLKGNPTIEEPRKHVYNKETMERLWSVSEQLTAVRYPFQELKKLPS